ncbi:MAG: N-acetylmuramoyl-L-alanine amidase [Caulobacterales bacterium]|nr:N-acetylmuramoyl-L-alanine amidase [Caulobacterales bacterium]
MIELTVEDAPSPNFDERDAPPDMLLLHYTGMATGAAALARLRDPAPVGERYAPHLVEPPADLAAPLPRVSAHYVVEEDGRVFRLVAEDKRAWHAGVSYWAGERDINARAVGVEIVNGGHDYGLPDFPHAQIEAVIALSRAVLRRWSIPPWRVLGHSDVAPGRKRDPGPRFPWARLAQEGVGLALAPAPPAPGEPPPLAQTRRDLAAWGYDIAPSGALDAPAQAVIDAFHDRWRGQGDTSGTGWTGTDAARLAALFAAAEAAADAGDHAGRPYRRPPPRRGDGSA